MSFVIYPLICAAAAGIILVAARLLRLRYSLRSLGLFVLLAGSCEALYINWGPWRCERVLEGHEGAVYSASFSPDGKRVVTAGHDDTAQVWDSSSGSEVALLMGHEGWVQSASFSPDGKSIITASLDCTARVWDSTNGKGLALLEGHWGLVCCARFSPDGKRIVTAGSGDRTARVWDSSSGKELVVLKGHTLWVNSASFSPDGTSIVTASNDGTARVWDSSSGSELAVLRGHAAWVSSASFSPDAKRIVTASYDKTARIWRRTRPEWWWGIFYMLEFWFSAVFAVGLVASLIADRRAFARMDAEAARAKGNRSRCEAPPGPPR